MAYYCPFYLILLMNYIFNPKILQSSVPCSPDPRDWPYGSRWDKKFLFPRASPELFCHNVSIWQLIGLSLSRFSNALVTNDVVDHVHPSEDTVNNGPADGLPGHIADHHGKDASEGHAFIYCFFLLTASVLPPGSDPPAAS